MVHLLFFEVTRFASSCDTLYHQYIILRAFPVSSANLGSVGMLDWLSVQQRATDTQTISTARMLDYVWQGFMATVLQIDLFMFLGLQPSHPGKPLRAFVSSSCPLHLTKQ